MAVFMLVRCRVHDREAFGAYAVAAAGLVARHGGRYLVRGGHREVLEPGLGAPDATLAHVISEWPTREAAMAFWNSTDYAAVRELRAACAEAEVLLLDGVP